MRLGQRMHNRYIRSVKTLIQSHLNGELTDAEYAAHHRRLLVAYETSVDTAGEYLKEYGRE